MRTHLLEITIFGAILLLLSAGTFWRNDIWNEEAIYHLKTALQLDPLLPRRAEIRTLVRLLEGLP